MEYCVKWGEGGALAVCCLQIKRFMDWEHYKSRVTISKGLDNS